MKPSPSSSLPPAAAKASTVRSPALIVILTAEDAAEVQHKMAVLADTDDLQDDYGITKADAAALRDSVPTSGQWIVIPEFVEAVKGEIADHCVVLRDIASDARRNREQGQALRISKQAKRLETLFALTA